TRGIRSCEGEVWQTCVEFAEPFHTGMVLEKVSRYCLSRRKGSVSIRKGVTDAPEPRHAEGPQRTAHPRTRGLAGLPAAVHSARRSRPARNDALDACAVRGGAGPRR